jgi:hypothetical protein
LYQQAETLAFGFFSDDLVEVIAVVVPPSTTATLATNSVFRARAVWQTLLLQKPSLHPAAAPLQRLCIFAENYLSHGQGNSEKAE